MKYLLAEYENKWKNDIFRNYYYIIQELIKHDFKLLDMSNISKANYKDILIDPTMIIIIENHNDTLPNDWITDLFDHNAPLYLITDDFHKNFGRKILINYYHYFKKIFCPYYIPFLLKYPGLEDKLIWFPHAVPKEFKKEVKLDALNKILMTGIVGKVYPMRIIYRDLAKTKEYKYKLDILNHISPKYAPINTETDLVGDKFIDKISRYKSSFTCGSEWGYLVTKYFEIPLAGSLLFCDMPKDNLELLGFKDNINCIFYNKDNLIEKINWIVDPKNNQVINQIRKNGQELILNNHTWDLRISQLLSLL